MESGKKGDSLIDYFNENMLNLIHKNNFKKNIL